MAAPFPFEKPAEAGEAHRFDCRRELRALVDETAPKVFALVAEWDCGDGWRDGGVVAWGVEWEGGEAIVLRDEGRGVMLLASAERAVAWVARLTGEEVRLMWPGGEASAASETDADAA